MTVSYGSILIRDKVSGSVTGLPVSLKVPRPVSVKGVSR